MGLMLTSSELFPVGSRLLLWLEMPEMSSRIRVIGRVIWVAQEPFQERYRHGFQFEALSKEVLKQLRALIALRSGQGA